MQPMNRRELLRARMASHLLGAGAGGVLQACRHMLAIQSQDLAAGRYALAQRADRSTSPGQVDEQFNRGAIVRSWTMRGTLHTCAAQDVRWLVAASRERIMNSMQTRLRELRIEDRHVREAGRLVAELLCGGRGASRTEIFALLNRYGIDTARQRGVHLLLCLALEGLICLGPIPPGAGRHRQDFVLLEDWIGAHHAPPDALHELLTRYLRGHGPATVHDARWYTGHTVTTLRRVVSELGDLLLPVGQDRRGEWLYVVDGSPAATVLGAEQSGPGLPLRLLGPFDEYYLGYADRDAVADPAMQRRLVPGGNGMLMPFWLRAGRVEGLWDAANVPPGPTYRALHERFVQFRS